MRCPTAFIWCILIQYPPMISGIDDTQHHRGGIGGNERYFYFPPWPCIPPPMPPLPDEPIVVTVSEIVKVAIVLPPV